MSYNQEFRLSAVRLALQEGNKIAQVARELNINENTLHTWINKYKTMVPVDAAPESIDETAKLMDELKQAKKEIAKLKEERAILVKAATFFAKESSGDTNS